MDTNTAQAQEHEQESESPLVGLSEKAAEKVREIHQAEGIEAGYGLRLRIVGGGCSGFSYDLYFDQAGEGDKTLDSHGVKIVVDPMSLQYLIGTEIDYVEGLHGAGFKFGNPNVKSTCGCGSSFSV
ncbi:MAG: iron-sulfur cluster insertion protein ErpA [Myxococcota bacterium]